MQSLDSCILVSKWHERFGESYSRNDEMEDNKVLNLSSVPSMEAHSMRITEGGLPELYLIQKGLFLYLLNAL
jgi:hypothetical protein